MENFYINNPVLAINTDENRIKYAYNIVKETNPMGFIENSMSPLPDTLHKSPLDNIYLLKRSREQIQAQEIVDAHNKDLSERERWDNIADGFKPENNPRSKNNPDVVQIPDQVKLEPMKKVRGKGKKTVLKEIETDQSLPEVPSTRLDSVKNEFYFNQLKEK